MANKLTQSGSGKYILSSALSRATNLLREVANRLPPNAQRKLAVFYRAITPWKLIARTNHIKALKRAALSGHLPAIKHLFDYASYIDQAQQEAIHYALDNPIKITIVIPSFRDGAYLSNCVKSINLHAKEHISEIIISDDYSNDPEHTATLETIKKNSGIPVKLIFSNENGGFSKNVNRGLRAANTHQDVLLLNSDVEVSAASVQVLIYTGQLHKAVIGARLLYPDGTIQHAGGFRNFNSLEWFEHLYRLHDKDFPLAIIDTHRLYCTAAVLYLPAEVRKRVGFFDEHFLMGFEDVDFCLRAWDIGTPVLYCGSAEFVHHECVTRGKAIGERELRSQDYFWAKHGDSFFRRSVIDFETGTTKVIFVLKDAGVKGDHRVIFTFANYLSQNGFSVEMWFISGSPEWFALNPSIALRRFTDFEQMTRALKPLNAIKVATWWETADCVWHSSLLAGIPAWLVQDVDSSYYQNDELAQIRVLSGYRPEFVYLINSTWIINYFELELLYHSNFVGLGIDDIYVSGEHSMTHKTKRSLLVCARSEPLKDFEYSKRLIRRLLKLGFTVTAFGLDETLISDLPGVTFYKKPTDVELKKLYCSHEFFLQTSLHEGFSLPPLEAMACGCIPIVTTAGGNEEYIREMVNSVVISRDIAPAIEKIGSLEYQLLFSQLSEGMSETVEAYRWSECLPRLSALFKAISNNPVFGKTKY